jgi:hypothetical protein
LGIKYINTELGESESKLKLESFIEKKFSIPLIKKSQLIGLNFHLLITFILLECIASERVFSTYVFIWS